MFLLATAMLPFSTAWAGPGCATATATVTVDWEDPGDRVVQGVVARVSFPAGVGFDVRTGPKGAVENLTGMSGALFDATARDEDGDGTQDLLTIGMVGSRVPEGRFARVRFACLGDSPPKSSDFTCVLEAATPMGDVDGTCRVELDATPST